MRISTRQRIRVLQAAHVAVILFVVFPVLAQVTPAPTHSAPLVLTGSIPLPGVQGRIDHMSLDPGGRLFISALGNNSVEVLDLAGGVRAQSIRGITRPQGVFYYAAGNKLFVGTDDGKLCVYDGTSFTLITSIDFGDDVDNLRYDPSDKLLYVGYGDKQDGALGVVDVTTNKRLPKDIKLGAHPESFQIEQSGPYIYVNLPELNQIAAINRKTGAVTRWHVPFESNFPMALDEASHRLFVATRGPARLAVFDVNTGRLISEVPCVQNSDDLFYDSVRKRIYISGGEGFISVVQQHDADRYAELARVPSAVGARTSGYFGRGRKGFETLYVAVPARAGMEAEVLLFTIQD